MRTDSSLFGAKARWILLELLIANILCSTPVWQSGMFDEYTLLRGIALASIFLIPAEFFRFFWVERKFGRKKITETIGKFLQECQNELENALVLSLDNRRFIFRYESQIIRSYEIFWRHLVKEQEARSKQPLTVLIIAQSSSFDIWSKYVAISEKLLRSQKSFCELGGNVTHIFCAMGEPTDEVKDVAAKMKESHIKVYYYDISTAKVDFDFNWDFLYVKETEIAVIWESFDVGASIKESTYQIGNEFRGYNLENLWRNIDKNSKPLLALITGDYTADGHNLSF